MARRVDAFISYTRDQGAAAADELQQFLNAEGLLLWQDRTHMRGGESFWAQIEAAIDGCEYLLMVLSPDAFRTDREILRNEWLTARRRGVPVLPVYLDQFVDWDDLSIPPWLSRLHRHNLSSDYERAKLVGVLRSPPSQRIRIPHNVEFPMGFVERAKEHEQLVKLLTQERASSRVAITTAVRGAGGFGKTTLARAVCFDDRVIATFTDGVLWATVGLVKQDPPEHLRTLLASLTDDRSEGLPLEAAQARWRELLRTRHCLIVLDDLWREADAEVVLVRDSPSMFLVTTRIPTVAVNLGARDCVVDRMTPAEGNLLLANAFAPYQFPDGRIDVLAHRLGRWPVLLRLAAGRLKLALLRRATPEEALASVETDYEELGITAFDLRSTPDHERARESAVDKTISASLAFADDSEERVRRYYESLAVLPEDVNIPLEVLADLWQTSRNEARRLAEHLDNAALLEFDFQRGVRVHDVFLLHMRARVGDLPLRHQELLTRWGDPLELPHDYAWRWFGWHCVEAREPNRLFAAITNPRWLLRKLEHTDVNALLADFDTLRRYLKREPDGALPPKRAVDRRTVILLQDAVRKSAHIVQEDKRQLPQQLFGRLRSGLTSDLDRVQDLCASECSSPLSFLWPSLEPAGSPLIRTLTGHRGGIYDVLPLFEGRVVSTSHDRTLRVWDTSTAEVFDLKGHSEMVYGLAALSSSLVLSWSTDSTLRVWDLTTKRQHALLQGHSGAIHGATLLSGDRVLSWSEDGTLRVWNLTTQEEKTLRGHTGSIYGVAVLPGDRVLSSSADQTLRLFDLETGESRAFEGHEGTVYGVALLRDGQAVSWSEDGTLRVWNVSTGSCRVLRGHEGPVLGSLVLDDGRVISWSRDSTLQLWDVATAERRPLRGHDGGVNGVVAPTNRTAVSWSDDGTLRVWDLVTAEARVLIGHERAVHGVRLLDANRALSWSADRTLRLWNLATGTEQALTGHEGPVHGAAWLPDERVLSWSADCTIRLWDLTMLDGSTRASHRGWILGLLSLSNGRAVSWSEDGTLRVWDLSGGESRVLTGHTDWINGVVLLGERRALSWSRDSTLRVWDLTSCDGRALAGHSNWVKGVAIRSDGRPLSWSVDGTVRLWDLATGESSIVLRHNGPIDGMVLLPDDVAVPWSADGSLWVLNLEDHTSRQLVGHTDAVRGAMLLSDDELLSWSEDGTLRSWRLDTGKGTRIGSHDAPIWGVALLPDGRPLSWSEDSTMRIWHNASGHAQVLAGHTLSVDGVVFTPDGVPMSWSADGTMRIWNLSSGESSVLTGHQNVITGVIPLKHSRALSWSGDRTVRVWDTTDARQLAVSYFDAWPQSVITAGENRFLIGDALGRLHALKLESE